MIEEAKWILSAMSVISRKVLDKALSELLIWRRTSIDPLACYEFWSSNDFLTVLLFWYLAPPLASKDAFPLGGPIIVDKSVPLRSLFSAAPTREGSAFAFSLLNVLHSEPTSMTLKSKHVNWDGTLIPIVRKEPLTGHRPPIRMPSISDLLLCNLQSTGHQDVLRNYFFFQKKSPKKQINDGWIDCVSNYRSS